MTNYITAILLSGATLAALFLCCRCYLRAKNNCYLLMDTFSDTVLFQYHVRKDLLSFSANATGMLRLDTCALTGCFKHLPCQFIHPDDQELFQKLLTETTAQETGGQQIRLIRPDGRYFWCLIQVRCRCIRQKKTTVIGKITDMEDVIRREKALVRAAQMDGLTGLYNRGAAEEKISALIGQYMSGVFYMIDIDNFKQINDEYGHVAGDSVIQFIAGGMRKTFSQNEILGRTGGDEFIVFSSAALQPADAKSQIDTLVRHFETASRVNLPSISISTGIALFPSDGITYQELYHAADNAMYAAKRSGKGRTCFYQDI